MLYVCSLTTPIAAVLLASLPTVTAGQRAAAAAGKKHTARRRRLSQTGADYYRQGAAQILHCSVSHIKVMSYSKTDSLGDSTGPGQSMISAIGLIFSLALHHLSMCSGEIRSEYVC